MSPTPAPHEHERQSPIGRREDDIQREVERRVAAERMRIAEQRAQNAEGIAQIQVASLEHKLRGSLHSLREDLGVRLGSIQASVADLSTRVDSLTTRVDAINGDRDNLKTLAKMAPSIAAFFQSLSEQPGGEALLFGWLQRQDDLRGFRRTVSRVLRPVSTPAGAILSAIIAASATVGLSLLLSHLLGGTGLSVQHAP